MIQSDFVRSLSEIDEDDAVRKAVNCMNDFIIRPYNIKRENILEYRTEQSISSAGLYMCEMTITWWEDADG